jgi:hypothetical protein
VEEVSIPGVPTGVDWEDHEGWTASTVRAGIEAVAKANNEDPEELVATDGAGRDVIGKEQAAERSEAGPREDEPGASAS